MKTTGRTKRERSHVMVQRTVPHVRKRAMTPESVAGELYLELIRMPPLRPLRSDADLDRAVMMVDALTERPELAPEQADSLEVLSRLIEDYEAEHDPLPAMSPVEA